MKFSQSRILLCILLFVGCATTDTALERPTTNQSAGETARENSDTSSDNSASEKDETHVASGNDVSEQSTTTNTHSSGDMGFIHIDLSDPEGIGIKSRVEFHHEPAVPAFTVEVPRGVLDIKAPVGFYIAYIQTYQMNAPFTVKVRPIEVKKDEVTPLSFLILEGRTGNMPDLREFDRDTDLATDSAEFTAGTDPSNPFSVPGRKTINYENRRQLLNEEEGWYRGDLMVNSDYGSGSESVAKLVKRAEKAGLDFLAITDLNTMAAMDDPDFKSDQVVLIPAQAWGNKELGIGLIYAPGTIPAHPSSLDAAQSVCGLAQSQGGIFAVAHPMFSEAPWQWGLSYVNAVQVWCGEWRGHAPLEFNQLNATNRSIEPMTAVGLAVKESESAQQEDWNNRIASGIGGDESDIEHLRFSANMQAEYYYDIELNRGLMASVIGGSNSKGPQTPLGKPLTYIYAREKSLPALMEGLQYGRTIVTSGPDGPELQFQASFLRMPEWADHTSSKVDPNLPVDITKPTIHIGGVIPLDTAVLFQVEANKAKGLKLEILRDGRPVFTKIVEDDGLLTYQWREKMLYRASYRARLISPPKNLREGYGVREVHALTSPIYAREVYIDETVLPVRRMSDE